MIEFFFLNKLIEDVLYLVNKIPSLFFVCPLLHHILYVINIKVLSWKKSKLRIGFF
ncbi:hypothetical protein Lalb_Chr24g0400871 [Lupinus albus]|uniref:Uncharacterized protein n=1 Tax=Lupinus albus TaxID=3870 RepID=A0A6A4MS04_LUPAL|nr:hypothetical protein Lalb_Chr24g0400871 [Lupinus albus]